MGLVNISLAPGNITSLFWWVEESAQQHCRHQQGNMNASSKYAAAGMNCDNTELSIGKFQYSPMFLAWL